MERSIRVSGRGKLSVKPDVTRLILELEGTEKEYADALRLSSEMTERLKSTAEGFGFTRQDLKTLSFGVETVYESYEDRNRSWKQRFAGYRYSHSLKLEFPSDSERLGRLLYALGHCEAKPEIRIEYTVADPEAVKNELLAKAVADSKTKAAVLAEAAGIVLGDIVTVDYSWAELELVTRPMSRMLKNGAVPQMDCCEESYGLDIVADDITAEDTVTVVWEIR